MFFFFSHFCHSLCRLIDWPQNYNYTVAPPCLPLCAQNRQNAEIRGRGLKLTDLGLGVRESSPHLSGTFGTSELELFSGEKSAQNHVDSDSAKPVRRCWSFGNLSSLRKSFKGAESEVTGYFAIKPLQHLLAV